MKTEVVTEKQLFFEEEVVLTQILEFGFSWREFSRGTRIPPEGARFDIHFAGVVNGDKINGTIEGVDYLEVRADGRLSLNLQATLTTSDGAIIKVTETGINNNGQLRLNMTFHTNENNYAWLNNTQVWGVGDVNFQTGKVYVKAYMI